MVRILSSRTIVVVVVVGALRGVVGSERYIHVRVSFEVGGIVVIRIRIATAVDVITTVATGIDVII